ncbi:MAG TPA: glutamate-cysteine ligase family protein [Polyangiaceae bacterium]|nr:glutamate-cysteine ligase family protein [Polyangiaceae bacterium]
MQISSAAQSTLNSSPVLTDPEQLLRPFQRAFKPPEAFRVGTEAEKFGVVREGLAPLPFEGEVSLSALFTRFTTRGWKPLREYSEGPVVGLQRGSSSITLEPGGQLELSGAPFASIHDTAREFEQHFAELSEFSAELGILWLSAGFHPLAAPAEFPLVPKLRYPVMRRYLSQRANRGLDMMFRTCTVQANLDYSDEQDALRKLRVALALQPIVTAMFANSPFVEGEISGRLSERGDVWLEMDPDRTGLLPFLWQRSATFRDYVDWALDVPCFLVRRGAKVVENTGQTFRRFMSHGFGGTRAVESDWVTHLNTLFPEVRLKSTIEVRGADAQSKELTCALPALWKGLLYDERSLAKLEDLLSSLDPVSVADSRREMTRDGLNAQLGGRLVRHWAEQVFEIAKQGLLRNPDRNEAGQCEDVYLAPLGQFLERGLTPAQLLVEQVRAGAPWRGSGLREGIVEVTRIL